MSYYIGATGETIFEELIDSSASNVVIATSINFDTTPLTDAIQQTITDTLGTAVGELIAPITEVPSATGVGVISLTALGLLSYYKLNRTAVQDVDSMVYSADYSSILTPGMFDDRVRIRYDTNWFSNAYYYDGTTKKGEILTYRPEQGSNILNLNATNIKLGTINNARLPANYGTKLGIGTSPIASADLHIYDATNANLLLETGATGTASIELQRGTINDVNVDFKIINDTGRFKILSQDEVNLYTAGTSEILRLTRTLMTNYKDFYNLGNVSIGLAPDTIYPSQLRVYNATNTILRLETDTTGKASIEFQRGVFSDANVDYRIINESDLFKIQSQNATNLYTAGTMELIRISPTQTINYKDFLNNGAFNNLGNVNISTTAGTSTYKLNVEGDVNIAGIGKMFYVNNSPVVSSQWTTAGTTIEYNGGSVGIGSFASHKLNVGGTINADGLITAQAGITIATGQLLTLSGTAGITSAGLITANGGITTSATSLISANNGITIATGKELILLGTATITSGGLITANGGITTSATGLITANNGITIATGKALTLSGTATITSGGLITAQAGLTISTGQTLTLAGSTTMTAGGLISANGGIQASTIKTNGGGLLKMATSTADFTQIGTTDSLLSVATCINLCGYTHPTHPSCILHTCEGVGHHKFFSVSSGFIDERFRIWSNGAVGIQKPNGSSTPGGNGGYAIYNGYMAGGSLTIGNIGTNYGGGTGGWTTNTAGLLMECSDNTEIAVHDSGQSIHSFMRYTTNGNFTIGRNMGYGVANVSVVGNLYAGSYYLVSGRQVIYSNSGTSGQGNFEHLGSIHCFFTYCYGLRVIGNFSVDAGYTKNWRIKHPILKDKDLIHTCIEGTRADNLYRGRKQLINGECVVNIDLECNTTGGMTDGTFILINKNIQVFVNNNETFDRVIGKVVGNKLNIKCENVNADCMIDWLVIGERCDEGIILNPSTDKTGSIIVELDRDKDEVKPQPDYQPNPTAL